METSNRTRATVAFALFGGVTLFGAPSLIDFALFTFETHIASQTPDDPEIVRRLDNNLARLNKIEADMER